MNERRTPGEYRFANSAYYRATLLAMAEFGKMAPAEIDAFLREHVVGRIACQAAGRPYIVPVAYTYDGKYVYGYSSDGLKLRIMRENPMVCFEVDEIGDLTDWQSVVAYGRFEELHDKRAVDALELLSSRLRTAGLFGEEPASEQTFVTRRGAYGLAYRIALLERSGRFERHADEA